MPREESGDAIRRLTDKYADRDDVIMADSSHGPDEWQCTECGFVVADEDVRFGQRPSSCPDCNCVNGDAAGRFLFIPREACGWFE